MFLRFIHVVAHTSSLFPFIAEYNLFYGNIPQKHKIHGKKIRLFNPGAGLPPLLNLVLYFYSYRHHNLEGLRGMLLTCGVQSNNLSTLFTAISYSHFIRKFTPKSVELYYAKWKVSAQVTRALGFPQKRIYQQMDKQNMVY